MHRLELVELCRRGERCRECGVKLPDYWNSDKCWECSFGISDDKRMNPRERKAARKGA